MQRTNKIRNDDKYDRNTGKVYILMLLYILMEEPLDLVERID